MELQFFLPLAIFIALFILVSILTKKNVLNNNHFVRIRILLGCLYVGYLIPELINAESARSVVILALLMLTILIGAYSLQKKYFKLIEPGK